MTSIEDRLMAVESRVGHLKTWAGPGQVEALSSSLTALRADLATFRREVRSELAAFRREMTADQATFRQEMTADQATFRREMTAELGTIKTRLGGIEDAMAEMLRRLPPSPGGH